MKYETKHMIGELYCLIISEEGTGRKHNLTINLDYDRNKNIKNILSSGKIKLNKEELEEIGTVIDKLTENEFSDSSCV